MRSLLAALVLLLPLSAHAETLSYTWSPRSPREAQALRAGLALHSLRDGLRSGGTVLQWGRNNRAALSQSGTGQFGAILQRGNGHSARLDQSGDGNAHAIL